MIYNSNGLATKRCARNTERLCSSSKNAFGQEMHVHLPSIDLVAETFIQPFGQMIVRSYRGSTHFHSFIFSVVLSSMFGVGCAPASRTDERSRWPGKRRSMHAALAVEKKGPHPSAPARRRGPELWTAHGRVSFFGDRWRQAHRRKAGASPWG